MNEPTEADRKRAREVLEQWLTTSIGFDEDCGYPEHEKAQRDLLVHLIADALAAHAGHLRAQRDALVAAAETVLSECKNDVGGEYSSPSTRMLVAALAAGRGEKCAGRKKGTK